MFMLANEELLYSYSRPISDLDLFEVIDYFEALAPAELSAPPLRVQAKSTLLLERRSLQPAPDIPDVFGIANVQLLDVFDDRPSPELIVCDMLSGHVFWGDPEGKSPLLSLARLSNPVRAYAVDLDQDGRTDLLIADLGVPVPSSEENGSIVWLRQKEDKSFDVIPLVENLGRVADVRAADFDGDGDLDIIAAVFGWRGPGCVLYLENLSETQVPGELPRFRQRILDERDGAIHVPIVDLNEDGKPDFVVLFAQEHETIEAFINRGGGEFERKTIFTAPHPHWGFTGMELVDLDGDGDLDILLTNGDTMDDGIQFKPYHGVSWLENLGDLNFKYHSLGTYYGAHRALAVDLNQNGNLDIIASSFLPRLDPLKRRAMNMSGVIWYEQVAKGVFEPRWLGEISCDIPALNFVDFGEAGKRGIIVGYFPMIFPPPHESGFVELFLIQ